jgi:hypothetical protein
MEKATAFLNRLNGWQRLFAVLMIFWQIPATVSYVIDVAPDNVPAERLYKAVAKAGMDYKKTPGFRVFNPQEFHSTSPDTDNETVKEVVTRMVNSDIYEMIAIPTLGGPDYIMVVPKKEMPEDRKVALAKLLHEEISKENSKSIVMEVAKIIFGSFSIALLMYVGGMSIGWIIKGFRNSPKAQ